HEDVANVSWGVDLAYLSEHGKVQVKVLWEAIRAKKQFIKTAAGLLDLQDMRFSWLREVSEHQFLQEGALTLSSLEWMRLILVEKLEPPTLEDVGSESSLQFLQEIQTLQTTDLFDLEGLTSCLRPYQEKGVQWLWFLYSYGLSGLLCDEMGLGKTHQAMALLVASMNGKRSKRQKFLVVCPTSVIYHWEELLKRFLPNAQVCMFYGVQRCLKGFEETGDILLTSYGILRSEKEILSEITFEITVFDELQVAKNAGSQIHKVLKTLKSRMKIGLTGTPIENHLMELHSLFDIILPNYLPSEAAYKELFIAGIEKNQDLEKKQLLTKMVHPFILRRKKEEVLQDLPEKTEEIAYVDLSDEQKKMYREACQKQKERIFSEIDEGQLPYMHVFALFNVLKQICDHPALINKDIENYEKYSSGKWDLFVELLQEARDSGQKVVVFSQYLKMLDIIEMHLKRNHIGYAQIRGSTKWRKEEMRRFKEDPACEVFIGSLQAAGVGIELVSASVVIHYDRWWNPAKENQATDRVHRIGQNRGVQVFKLVSKETIEEHIHSMIERKLYLVKEIIGYDDQHQIKSLSKEELLGLLKSLENYM
ncbi:MAG: DEAD/DEAH box helicase, partial [Chlamydiota bacterium]